jgi:hypothetical protein
MIDPPGRPRRGIVRVTTTAGTGTDLTGDLPWREALAMLRRLRQIFSDHDARAGGWTLTPVSRGFVASRGSGLSVTFSASEVPGMELVGRGRRLAALGAERSGAKTESP